MQDFAEHQPVTVAANALRGLMLGDGALASGQTVTGQVGLSPAWSGAIVALSSSPSLCMPTTGTEPELSNLHKERSIDWVATEACRLHTRRPEAELLGGW